MSQPVSAQLRGSDLGLITPSLPQWQPVQEQFEGSNGLIPPSLLQPQLQAPVPQPVSAQIGGSLNSGLVPSLSQWQPVPVQFRGSASGLIPPPPSQLQAPVSQPVSAPIGGSLSSGLIPSSLPQWQPVAAQSGSSNLGLTPPSLPQLCYSHPILSHSTLLFHCFSSISLYSLFTYFSFTLLRPHAPLSLTRLYSLSHEPSLFVLLLLVRAHFSYLFKSVVTLCIFSNLNLLGSL
jgi:hypothetical protein